MPRGDQTGPMGQGPMTGRGAGYCAGIEGTGYATTGPRGGWGMGWCRGRGRGFGYGWGRGFAASPPDSRDEPSRLKAQSENLKKQLDAIEQRLAEFEKKD